MDNERLKLWLGLAKFFLGTVVLGLVSTFISHQIQQKEVELKELDQLSNHVPTVIDDSVHIRRRFAQYFSVVLSTPELRERWNRYLILVEAEYGDTKEQRKAEQLLEDELSKQKQIAEEKGNEPQVQLLEAELDAAHARVSALTSELTRSAKESCQAVILLKQLGWRSGHKTKFCLARGYDGVHNPFSSYGDGGFCFKGPSTACIAEINSIAAKG